MYTTSCAARRRVPGGEHGKGSTLVLCKCTGDSSSGVVPKSRGHLRNRWHDADCPNTEPVVPAGSAGGGV